MSIVEAQRQKAIRGQGRLEKTLQEALITFGLITISGGVLAGLHIAQTDQENNKANTVINCEAGTAEIYWGNRLLGRSLYTLNNGIEQVYVTKLHGPTMMYDESTRPQFVVQGRDKYKEYCAEQALLLTEAQSQSP